MSGDLVAFLRARLDEDEQLANTAAEAYVGEPPVFEWDGEVRALEDTSWDYDAVCRVVPHIDRHDPARVLREVEAKRQIIDECVATLNREDAWDPQLDGGSGEEFDWARWLPKMLAAPYADHPDYDEVWRL